MKNKKSRSNLTGYFGFFKEIKKPIRSGEEATLRLRKCKNFRNFNFILAIVAAIVGCLLQNVPKVGEIIFNVLIFISLPTFVIGAIAIFWAKSLDAVVKKFENLNCSNCNSRIGYDENVSYDVLRNYENYEEKTDNNGRKTITQTHHADVRILCKCQNCGKQKTISETFTYARYVNGDRKYLCEVPDLVKKYFADIE